MFNMKKGINLFKALSNETRYNILRFLLNGERCVCEIYPNLDLAQNLVSSHLKVMLEFGLINVRQEWKRNYYSVNQDALKKYNSLLNIFLQN